MPGDGASFFTFPLPVLAMPLPEKERLQMAISNTMHRAGLDRADIGEDQIADYSRQHAGIGFNRSATSHQTMVRGAIAINVNIGHVENTIKRLRESEAFVARIESTHGPSPLVFVAAELLWGCHNSDSPSFREFSVLCAVNSVIGFKKSPVLIRRQMLIARQLGYKSPAVMLAEIRPDQKPLTTQELRTILDRLETRELVFRCWASPRNVYFSNTLKPDELRKAVQERRENRNKVKLRRDIDRETFGATTQQPQPNHLKRKLPIQAETQPLKKEQPESNQTPTTTATTTPTTKRKASKQEPLNKRIETKALKDAGALSPNEKPEAGKQEARNSTGTTLFADIRKAIEETPPS